MAHEIGHSLGLSHDPEGCCVEAVAEQGGCVMEAATGYVRRTGVAGPGSCPRLRFFGYFSVSFFCKMEITTCL
jgi:hypothetical protein